MGPLIAAGSGALLVAGVILLVAGLGRRIPDAPVSRPWTVRLVARWRAMGARRRLWVVLCVGAGVVTGIWTGWLAAVVLIPLVLLGIPYLLSEPPNPEVEILAALDRWLRFLGPSIATGKSIRDAIITTRGQVPQVLTTPVARVVARLDLGWTTRDALIAMADELESADADGVLAALAIASSRGGIGARAMLAALAENTQMRLRTLRDRGGTSQTPGRCAADRGHHARDPRRGPVAFPRLFRPLRDTHRAVPGAGADRPLRGGAVDTASQDPPETGRPFPEGELRWEPWDRSWWREWRSEPAPSWS